MHAPEELSRNAMQTPNEPIATVETPPARATAVNLFERARRNSRALTVFGLLAAGVIIIMLGWYGSAHTNIITEQIPYLISGGLLGLGLIILAGILAASASAGRENEELRREITRALQQAPRATAAFATAAANGHAVFLVPGGRSYHEAGCPILEGKDGVSEVQPAQALAFAPCKLCAAD